MGRKTPKDIDHNLNISDEEIDIQEIGSDSEAEEEGQDIIDDKNDKIYVQIANGKKIDLSKLEVQYSKLSHIEHILIRPDTYVGSTDVITKKVWIADTVDNELKCYEEEIKISEALERMFLEILSNAGDNCQKSRDVGLDPGVIKVKVDQYTVEIYNEGLHISTTIDKIEKIPKPELIFGVLLTSSNYNDEEERKVAGRNGYGAKITNVFSKSFKVEIGDPVAKFIYKQEFNDNLKTKTAPEYNKNYKGKGYTKITYKADFERLGMSKYKNEVINMFRKHTIDTSFTCKVPVFFNDVKLDYREMKEYVSLHRTVTKNDIYINDTQNEVEFYLCDSPDEGFTISFVNGIITREGGVHVDALLDIFFKPILAKYNAKEGKNKKIRSTTLTKKDIKPHLSLFMSCRLDKPKFTSQTKEKLCEPKPKFKLDKDILESSFKKLMKWEMIQRVEAELKAKEYKLLLKTDGKKTKYVDVLKVDEAEYAGTDDSHNCILFVTEGDSAKSLAMAALRGKRNYCGVYPLKGKPLNMKKASIKKERDNKEWNELKKVLGLKEGADYSIDSVFKTLRYGKLVIMSDQDTDGFHIRGLIISNIVTKFSSLAARGFLAFMETPLIIVTKGKKSKQKEIFYKIPEYVAWRNNLGENGLKGWSKPKYYKGLGSHDAKKAEKLFEDSRIKDYSLDDAADETLELVFGKNTDDRKFWLKLLEDDQFDFDFGGEDVINISDFVNKELILFSREDLERSIPSIFDGFKPSSRKVLYSILKKGTKELKVTQLAGFISENTEYHHGEQCLHSTITNMGQSFPGSNNIPLLKEDGQFGTRFQGGKDAAAARYLKCSLSPITLYIYKKIDNILLDYQEVEGNTVEPYHYFPIIPMFLINGSEGIGTGYSTKIPSYNPNIIIEWIRLWLIDIMLYKESFEDETKDYSPTEKPELIPWYRGYKGKIYPKMKTVKGVFTRVIVNEGAFTQEIKTNGLVHYKKYGDLFVTELPVFKWIDDYKVTLKRLQDKKIIKAYRPLSDLTNICFKIEGITKPSLRNLKLTTTISTTNMVLLDINNLPKKYNTIEEVLDEFCTMRYEKYEERRSAVIEQLENDLILERLRYNFVLDVIEDRLILRRREQTELEKEMKDKEYPLSFLSMALSSLTKSKLDELEKSIAEIEGQYQHYIESTPEGLWLEDLQELEDALDKNYK